MSKNSIWFTCRSTAERKGDAHNACTKMHSNRWFSIPVRMSIVFAVFDCFLPSTIPMRLERVIILRGLCFTCNLVGIWPCLKTTRYDPFDARKHCVHTQNMDAICFVRALLPHAQHTHGEQVWYLKLPLAYIVLHTYYNAHKNPPLTWPASN